MIALKELVSYLDDALEVSTIHDFCPNGLQVEGGQNEVTQIATAVSASLQTLEKAIELKPQVLIVHHGIFWNKDSYRILGTKREKIKLLLDHGISLLGYHLPLDCHKEWGNNWTAAKEMGWKNLKGFGPKYGEAHLGVMGQVEPISRQDFQKKLEEYYNHSATFALGGPEKIEAIALISGGGYKEIDRAVKANADAFITGSFDEPIWHIAHEEKINFFALGHSHTEKIGPKALGKHLEEKFSLKHQFLDIENPF